MRSYVLKIFAFLSSRFGHRLIQHRLLLVIGVQLVLIIAANLLTFLLRFGGDIPPDQAGMSLWGLPIVLTSYAVGLLAFGIQRGLWRYVGLHDLGRILWASVISSTVFYGVAQQENTPAG